MLPCALYQLILHNLTFYTITKLALVAQRYLRLAQDYFTSHPSRVNHLWVLIVLHPHAPWDWEELSANPNITPDIVRDHLYLPWSSVHLSRNPNLTWEELQRFTWRDWLTSIYHPQRMISGWLRDYSDYFWTGMYFYRKYYYHTEYLSLNPNITWDFVKSHPEIPWYYPWLMANPNITTEIIRHCQDAPLHYYPNNPNLDWNFIYESLQSRPLSEDQMRQLSRNPQITWDIVVAHPQVDWSYADLILNPNVTPTIIENHPEMRKVKCRHVANSNYTLADIVQAQARGEVFDGYYLSLNRNLTWRYVHTQQDELRFNWLCLSMNKFTAL